MQFRVILNSYCLMRMTIELKRLVKRILWTTNARHAVEQIKRLSRVFVAQPPLEGSVGGPFSEMTVVEWTNQLRRGNYSRCLFFARHTSVQQKDKSTKAMIEKKIHGYCSHSTTILFGSDVDCWRQLHAPPPPAASHECSNAVQLGRIPDCPLKKCTLYFTTSCKKES